MPGLRADLADDSNPSFVLDFVYNIVFNLPTARLRRAVGNALRPFVHYSSMRHHAAEFDVRHISHRREANPPA